MTETSINPVLWHCMTDSSQTLSAPSRPLASRNRLLRQFHSFADTEAQYQTFVIALNPLYTTKMRAFVFVSSKDPQVLGFAPNKAGSSLPAVYGPWKPMDTGGAILVGDDPDVSVVIEGIRHDGYFIAVGGYEDEPYLPSTAR